VWACRAFVVTRFIGFRLPKPHECGHYKRTSVVISLREMKPRLAERDGYFFNASTIDLATCPARTLDPSGVKCTLAGRWIFSSFSRANV